MSNSSSQGERPPRVFISYSWDSEAHKGRVFQLADRLRDEGVDAQLDQYEVSPPESWPNWMWNQIEQADFVLVVCTETYLRRFRGQEDEGRGQGVTWEGAILAQSLYEAGSRNTRFIPVVLSKDDTEHIPLVLKGATRYQLERDYEKLYRRLTDQPEFVKRPLGVVKELPPRDLEGPETELEGVYEKRAEALAAGDDTSHFNAEILRIKRLTRAGGNLQSNDLLVGRYKLREAIGAGGFATVWKAYDKKTRHLVAIKALHPQFAKDKTRRDRFFRGARLMEELQHPGIVRVLEPQAEDDGHYFFVMEYLPGRDLHRAVLAKQISGEQAVSVVVQVGKALAYAHGKGVIHRDVKPANILVGHDGQPKLIDFDLVRAHDTTGGTRTGAMGTFVFAAPEQLEDAKAADERADQFGLGMTLVFALYGRKLPKEILRDPDSVVDRLPCSRAIRAAIGQAIDWEPGKRWGSVEEFVETLSRLQETKSGVRIRILAAEVGARPAPRGVQPDAGTVKKGPFGMRFRFIPAGTYAVGSPQDEPGRSSRDWPRRNIELSRGFWLAETPVTQAQWFRLTSRNPARFHKLGGERPVEQVSWFDAIGYAHRLSEREGLSSCYWLQGCQHELGKGFTFDGVEWHRSGSTGFRLPTEAEWEVAARACPSSGVDSGGADSIRAGSEALELDAIAWYADNSGKTTQKVGQKRPNAWGLHDLLGNVWEWCWDWESAISGEPRTSGHGPVVGSAPVTRGGSWMLAPQKIRVAYRGWWPPGGCYDFVGFRLAQDWVG